MSKTCDWCGEMEPNSESFKSTGDRYNDTTLCPECCPDDNVERGIFVVYSFTAHNKDNTVVDSVENYLESQVDSVQSIKLFKDVGATAATSEHSRYALILDVVNGLTHYRMHDLLQLEAVIDASTGDPERNNCRANFYNYKVPDVLEPSEEPTLVYQNKVD